MAYSKALKDSQHAKLQRILNEDDEFSEVNGDKLILNRLQCHLILLHWLLALINNNFLVVQINKVKFYHLKIKLSTQQL